MVERQFIGALCGFFPHFAVGEDRLAVMACKERLYLHPLVKYLSCRGSTLLHLPSKRLYFGSQGDLHSMALGHHCCVQYLEVSIFPSGLTDCFFIARDTVVADPDEVVQYLNGLFQVFHTSNFSCTDNKTVPLFPKTGD